MTRFCQFIFLIGLFLGCLTVSDEARAATGPIADSPQLSARLMAGSLNNGTLPMALDITLKPGWKIYWRTAGDAGFPPALDWSGTKAIRDSRFFWPAPHRFIANDLQSFGYKSHVLIPFELQVSGPLPAQLTPHMSALACTDICVPVDLDLQIDLDGADDPDAIQKIKDARAAIPGPPHQNGLLPLNLLWQKDPPAVILDLRSGRPLKSPDAFIESDPYLPLGSPVVHLSDDGLSARLTLPFTGIGKRQLASWMDDHLTVTVTDGDEAVEVQMRPQSLQMAPPVGKAQSPALSLAMVLVLAVLGGLILNLMPCVLPVLSIKLLSVVSHGGGRQGAIRAGFLAAAAGVLVSFWLLAAILIGIKLAGGAIGWGIQFQQPLFLSLLTAITVLFAGNLFGWFEILLPSALADRFGKPSGEEPNLVGHFLSGALAMVLATPCSAPFLGTAIGFALASGAYMILLIFSAIGLGLALPYLLIAAFPAMVSRLPRPGAWMIKLKMVMGVALLATAGWLLHVLAGVAGERVGWMAAGCAAIILLLLRLAYHRRPVVPLVVVALTALVLTPFLAPNQAIARVESGPIDWQPFVSEKTVLDLAINRVVFVDVTADWCLTCQANKRLVLHNPKVLDALKSANVVMIEADWTRPNDTIQKFLADHGRYGIPFNIVYGPGAPDGIALPELLTQTTVIEAIEKAAGKP